MKCKKWKNMYCKIESQKRYGKEIAAQIGQSGPIWAIWAIWACAPPCISLKFGQQEIFKKTYPPVNINEDTKRMKNLDYKKASKNLIFYNVYKTKIFQK